MTPPSGYTKAKTGEVCKLKRSLYGLKQASRQWNKELNQTFTIKDLGSLTYFLGIEVYRDATGIFLGQRKYIKDLLHDAGMTDCTVVSAPLPCGLKLFIDDGDLLTEPEIYRRLVGKLLYLGITRPDLSYCVQHLNQFVHSPRVPHLRAVLHVLKYLKGTLDSGLWYSAHSDFTVLAYSDADWSSCQYSSRSLSAYATFLGSNLISWKTKKQQSVSKSSAEAEYRSMSATASELVWIQGLLEDLQVVIPLLVTLNCDNTSAEHLAQNLMFHEKTKHIKRDMHYVREQVESGFIQTAHVSSKNQLADLLTKPLASSQHNLLSAKLGLISKGPA
ncbi:uncharacterized mitochondrial protein AtMg00810-like [Beta vulgaris subsp. vulgaris]|uniref:uncharacterized mitochondrial protein AtMg00810-like n=1 Tax=Beta vulgaris subsp. vulgaris TaxID=3555 RepID=UPI00254985F7|nr:uncharacterized mitochondrial protein AtMg00810-like [Beta vulgaris subsp. vulgaris]